MIMVGPLYNGEYETNRMIQLRFKMTHSFLSLAAGQYVFVSQIDG